MTKILSILLLFFSIGSFSQSGKINKSATEVILKEIRKNLNDRNFSLAMELSQKAESNSVMVDSIDYYKKAIDYYSAMDNIYKAMRKKDIVGAMDLYNQYKGKSQGMKGLRNEIGEWIALYNLIPVVMEKHLFATKELADSITALSHKKLDNQVTVSGKQYYLKGTLVDLTPVFNGVCGAYFSYSAPDNLPNLPILEQVIQAITDNLHIEMHFNTNGDIISNEQLPIPEENIFFNLLIPQRNENGKWGYVDRKGNELIPFEYDDASFFSSGFAVIRKSKRVAYVDIFGNSTLDLEWFDKKSNL